MANPKFHSCKVGTQPWLIVLKPGSRAVVGRRIWFRRHDGKQGRWTSGTVTKVNGDGYFFVDLI